MQSFILCFSKENRSAGIWFLDISWVSFVHLLTDWHICQLKLQTFLCIEWFVCPSQRPLFIMLHTRPTISCIGSRLQHFSFANFSLSMTWNFEKFTDKFITQEGELDWAQQNYVVIQCQWEIFATFKMWRRQRKYSNHTWTHNMHTTLQSEFQSSFYFCCLSF